MNKENINEYLPSILNPRSIRIQHNHSVTQASFVSRASLSLKKPNGSIIKKNQKLLKNFTQDSKDLSGSQSFLNFSQETCKNSEDETKNQSETNDPLNTHKEPSATCNLGFEQEKCVDSNKPEFKKTVALIDSAFSKDYQSLNHNSNNVLKIRRFLQNSTEQCQKNIKDLAEAKEDDPCLSRFCSLETLIINTPKSPTITSDQVFKKQDTGICKLNSNEIIDLIDSESDNKSCFTQSSATELKKSELESVSTICYSIDNRPIVRVCFGVNECESVDINAKNSTIKRVYISHNDVTTEVDCELIEASQPSIESEFVENKNEISPNTLKRPAATVSLELKKKKVSRGDSTENSKILILNTNAIEKISHVIVQPPNYKFVKRNISHKSKYKKDKSLRNGNTISDRLKQATIESFFRQGADPTGASKKFGIVGNDVSKEMSRNLGVIDAVKCDRLRSARPRKDTDRSKSPKRGDSNESPQSARFPLKREIKTSNSITPPPRNRNESMSAHSPRKNVESIHFNLPVKSKSNKTSLSPRNIPHHKIVAGTHFAVDAFSYGEIPNVKHYFLTHFHSDHYSGLKKTFSKLLFCSKITADLCISRLGVNQKNIRVINVDEVLRIDGVEVAAVDANHCPGALMLVFTLPNGKTLLHTGDFRACPQMESYPVFWNKDIHTVYLDTTYCNPRYDFPTQDQSLEAALFILRQKKMALEKAGKKFSSVLIVCGTYTIGKEKFFMGMSRRVGCSVWACPEKERVLQIVEGRSFSREKPEACQLHVVPMRDLTHEKLRSYLDSLQGAFAEVVAFKPSGWENGKNSSVEKDCVTIHGIPYSEHSSFSELIRFVKFLKPKQVVPTVDISGGVKSVQKYFPCPLVFKEEFHCQTKVTDYFSIHSRQQVPAVT